MERALPDYGCFHFSKKMWLWHCACGGVYCFALGMLFFNHILLSLAACSGIFLYIRERRHEAARHRKIQLEDQFREGMYALGSAIGAGRSIEQAFIRSYEDLKLLYKEEDMILLEWEEIIRRIRMNETVEAALMDFALRSGLEEIQNFSGLLTMAKRSGGNLIQITREAIYSMNEKAAIQKDINIMVIQKQYEQKILSVILPLMIAFFMTTSPDFLQPLYNSLAGRAIMMMALVMYFISGKIGRRIVEIEV